MTNPTQIEERKPWQRVEGESDKAFAAFQVYLEVGTLEKTVDKIGRTSGKLRYMEELSSKYNWVARKQKYNDHLADISFQAIEQRVKSAAVQAFDYLQQALTLDIAKIVDENGNIFKPNALPKEIRVLANNYTQTINKYGKSSSYDLANKESIAKVILTMAGLLGKHQQERGHRPINNSPQVAIYQQIINLLPDDERDRLFQDIGTPEG